MQEHYNNKNQKGVRRHLRNNSTFSEKLLWKEIRNNQLGIKFRRQFGVGNYVVDFYCPKLKLAIEIDGATHETKTEIKNDIEKQEFLESLGIKVRRYTNTDVLENSEGVLMNLMDELNISY